MDTNEPDADDIAHARNDQLTYHGATRCRCCPDTVDQDPSIAIILPSEAASDAGLRPDDRVFVRAASGVVELVKAEQYCGQL